MSLEGFETISIGNAGLIVSITKNGTTFNKATVEKLMKPSNVLLLLNKEKKQFAIKAVNAKDAMSIPFCSNSQKGPSVRWNSKELLKKLSELAGWNLNTNRGYHINGTYISQEKAIVFDLNDAIPN